jgi:hypothetical protein
MRVHGRLLERLAGVRAGPRPRSFVLPQGDEYYARLQALPPSAAAPVPDESRA